MTTNCPSCASRDIIEIPREGERVCKGCGLVVEAHIAYDDVFHNGNFFEDHEVVHEPQHVSTNLSKMLSAAIIHLQLSEQIEQEARSFIDNITTKKTFRGLRAQSFIGSVIYIMCNRQKTQNFRRTAKEICDGLGVDIKMFSGVLREIYKIDPDTQSKIHVVHSDNSLTRQIMDTIQNINQRQVMDIARIVRRLDEERKTKRLLMGSPPHTLNGVLIYLACHDPAISKSISIKKEEYIKKARISKVTLDKHVKVVGKQLGLVCPKK